MECLEELGEKSAQLQASNNTKSDRLAEVTDMECSGVLDDSLTNSKEGNTFQESEERLEIRNSMLNHLSTRDNLFFKCIKEGESDLSRENKIHIAEELLHQDYGLFLARFGNHLLKEHLCYFENRSEEDGLIVDIYLQQLNKALNKNKLDQQTSQELTSAPLPEEKMELVTELSAVEKARQLLRNKMLNHLSSSKDAHFRSQQVGEPDLDTKEKREIAERVLDRSYSLFLAKFGTHLLEEHLDYFDQKPPEEKYEVEYHLKQLRKNHCKTVSEVGIKNRRFEALKKMVEEGSYFSETEMRNRNPLLYEELVGKYLTPEERKERLNNIDTTNITFVNLLLEQMDRETVKKLKKDQEDAEEDVMEEEDMSDEEMDEDDESDSEDDNDIDKTLWGEEYSDAGASVSKNVSSKKENKRIREIKTQKRKIEEPFPELSDTEKCLLMEEFRSSVFSNFIQGKDTDFDYSNVDNNPDYDDLEAQGFDEEEKYFDEESSQGANSNKMSDSEDLLEQFMNRLEPEPTSHQLAEKMNRLTHKDT